MLLLLLSNIFARFSCQGVLPWDPEIGGIHEWEIREDKIKWKNYACGSDSCRAGPRAQSRQSLNFWLTHSSFFCSSSSLVFFDTNSSDQTSFFLEHLEKNLVSWVDIQIVWMKDEIKPMFSLHLQHHINVQYEIKWLYEW